MSGVVSRTARNIPQTNSLFSLLYGSTLKLLVLGLLRLSTVWGSDYYVPQDEYGVHWNFFFTIAGVHILSTVVEKMIQNLPCKMLSLLVIGFSICMVLEYWHRMPLHLDAQDNQGGYVDIKLTFSNVSTTFSFHIVKCIEI